MRWPILGVALILLLAAPGSTALAVQAGQETSHQSRLVLGYYVPYDPASWASLETWAGLIDVVAAQWVTIDACGGIGSQNDRTLTRFAQKRGIRVLPSLLTTSSWLNHQLLTDPETTEHAVAEIVGYVEEEGYDGFDLDLEGVRPADRAAYTAFVARLGAALHERGKLLALAIPAKTTDTTTGWAGAFDYAALAPHADVITVMAYEYHGSWGDPGPIAPYSWVDRVLAFATSQFPPEKVLLGLAFYGFDWNTTSGGARYIGHPEAAALSGHYGVPIATDPETRSETFRYRAPAGERPPAVPTRPAIQHEIAVREPAPCSVADPAPASTPTPRPPPAPDAIQEHEVWLEAAPSAQARLEIADRHRAGGIAAWRLGHEDPAVWDTLGPWRTASP